jgi:hypothetical protein
MDVVIAPAAHLTGKGTVSWQSVPSRFLDAVSAPIGGH